jgi:hypothetical protein
MRRPLLLLLLLALVAAGGCARSASPIDDRALVLGVAADPGGQQTLKYTAEVPSPQSLSDSSGGGNSFYDVAASARSLDAAISRMEDKTSRDIYLGQMHVLLLNLALPPKLRDRLFAEEQRIGETDHTEWLVLTDGPAAKLLQPPPLQERLPAFYYSTHFNCSGCQSADFGVPAWRAEADLAGPGGVAVVPVAKLEGSSIAISRVAALRRGEKPFVFSPEESLLVMAMRGRLGKGSLDFPTPLGPAAVRGMRATVRRTAAVGQDRRLHIAVDLSYTGLVALPPDRVMHLTPQALAQTRQALAEELTRRAVATVARAKQQGVDAFYFARALYLRDPEAYRGLGDFSRAFRKAEVGIRVRVQLPQQGIAV